MAFEMQYKNMKVVTRLMLLEVSFDEEALAAKVGASNEKL